MAFRDFKSIQQAQQAFNIKYEESDYIEYDNLEPSIFFLKELEFNRKNIDIFSSEASRCENVIYPILREVYKSYISHYALWSHKALSYDEILSGIPDYLITFKSQLGKTILGSPIVVIVEAKQNNFSEGWGQCLAELVAAQKINQNELMPIHGVVTDGELWQFGKLVSNLFTKNETAFAISDLNKIFGALSFIIKDTQKYSKDI
jgi:hypothetical protein